MVLRICMRNRNNYNIQSMMCFNLNNLILQTDDKGNLKYIGDGNTNYAKLIEKDELLSAYLDGEIIWSNGNMVF